MRNDSELQRDVQEELRWEPVLHPAEIGVVVKDGLVTLTGHVDSYAAKLAAERAAKGVAGVRAVVEEIAVRLPGSSLRTDEDIARAALNALRWHVLVPDPGVKVTVENGWVTLEGQVEWEYQRRSAEQAVRYLLGVKGVINKITVTPKAAASEVKSKIAAALKRSAEVDAQRITVETKNGTVLLKGSVRSWFEREEAEKAAWAAPGVSKVDDRITVQP
jgi:osmotically-inducible protein OsmY